MLWGEKKRVRREDGWVVGQEGQRFAVLGRVPGEVPSGEKAGEQRRKQANYSHLIMEGVGCRQSL